MVDFVVVDVVVSLPILAREVILLPFYRSKIAQRASMEVRKPGGDVELCIPRLAMRTDVVSAAKIEHVD
jgi:hypothetical protein